MPGYDDLREALRAGEEARTSFLKACLTKLGLELSQESTPVPSLSKLHLSSLRPSGVGELLQSFDDVISKEDGKEFIKGENDTFHIEAPNATWCMAQLRAALGPESGEPPQPAHSSFDHDQTIKRVAAHDESWPEPKETPYFNHSVYYSSLREYRDRDADSEEWGDSLMYGEVVTSTNTLLDK